MKTPVIIAARNEELQIGHTLDTLANQTLQIEPIVIVNATTDRTADIARNAGATVLESRAGKMPAIQEGLRYLGDRALEPLIILDADSQPISKNWARRMTGELQGLPYDQPAVVWGPYIFNGEINPVLGAFFSATSMQVSWADRNKPDPRTVRGGNTGLKLKHEPVLEAMLALDNFWPREDVAIYDTLTNNDAEKKVVFHPEAWLKTSGFRIAETLRNIVAERVHPSKVADKTYDQEAPEGSKPYNFKDDLLT